MWCKTSKGSRVCCWVKFSLHIAPLQDEKWKLTSWYLPQFSSSFSLHFRIQYISVCARRFLKKKQFTYWLTHAYIYTTTIANQKRKKGELYFSLAFVTLKSLCVFFFVLSHYSLHSFFLPFISFQTSSNLLLFGVAFDFFVLLLLAMVVVAVVVVVKTIFVRFIYFETLSIHCNEWIVAQTHFFPLLYTQIEHSLQLSFVCYNCERVCIYVHVHVPNRKYHLKIVQSHAFKVLFLFSYSSHFFCFSHSCTVPLVFWSTFLLVQHFLISSEGRFFISVRCNTNAWCLEPFSCTITLFGCSLDSVCARASVTSFISFFPPCSTLFLCLYNLAVYLLHSHCMKFFLFVQWKEGQSTKKRKYSYWFFHSCSTKCHSDSLQWQMFQVWESKIVNKQKA